MQPSLPPAGIEKSASAFRDILCAIPYLLIGVVECLFCISEFFSQLVHALFSNSTFVLCAFFRLLFSLGFCNNGSKFFMCQWKQSINAPIVLFNVGIDC